MKIWPIEREASQFEKEMETRKDSNSLNKSKSFVEL